MNPQTAADAYRSASIENAPPVKVVRLMYEGALRFIDQAGEMDPVDQAAEFVDRIDRARTVVAELRIALDPASDPELCERLSSLYLFIEERLNETLQTRDAADAAPARAVIETLLDGWRQIELEQTPAPGRQA
jgi:flagellar protein FliS